MTVRHCTIFLAVSIGGLLSPGCAHAPSSRSKVAELRVVSAIWDHDVLRAQVDQVGSRDNLAGQLLVTVGAETFARRGATGREITVDTAALMPSVCPREDFLGQPLVVSFESRGGRVAVTQKDIDECIRRTVSGTLALQAQETAPSAREAPQQMALASLLARARHLAEGLPEADEERARTLSIVTHLSASLRDAQEITLAKLLSAFRAAPKKDPAKLAAAGSPVIEYIQLLMDVHMATSEEVVRAWVGAAILQPALSAESLMTLVGRDSDTRICLASSNHCPRWLHPKVVEVFEPYFLRLKEELHQDVERVHVAAVALRQNTTERNAEAVKRGILLATKARQAGCVLESWNQNVRAECTAVGEAVIEGNQALAASRERLGELQLASTAAAWREYVGRCTTVFKSWQRNQATVPCIGTCLDGRRRIIEQRRTLFQAPEGPLNATSKRELLEACRAAQCPRCP